MKFSNQPQAINAGILCLILVKTVCYFSAEKVVVLTADKVHYRPDKMLSVKQINYAERQPMSINEHDQPLTAGVTEK